MKRGVAGRRTRGASEKAGQAQGPATSQASQGKGRAKKRSQVGQVATAEANGGGPDGFQACAEVIVRRRKQAQVRGGYLRLGIRVLYLALIALILLTQVLLVTQAQGNDMFPAVKDGDVVLGFRLQNDYQADDVVVYQADGQRRIGRVIATEGDYVAMSESGSVTVNGTTVTGEVVYATYAKDGITYPYQVPDGCVFVLGDMRTQATDSRDFGAVPVAHVEAEVITIVRRRGV